MATSPSRAKTTPPPAVEKLAENKDPKLSSEHVDRTSKDSFPASDPPGWAMGSGHQRGPKQRTGIAIKPASESRKRAA